VKNIGYFMIGERVMRRRVQQIRQAVLCLLFLTKMTVGIPPAADALQLRFVAAFGEEGDGPGQLRRPQAVSTDDKGNVFVADTGNNRIQKFDRQGRFLVMIGGFGWANEQFQRPVDICADNGLDVFIADYENRRIARCDNGLHWITSFAFPEIEDERMRLGFPSSVGISIHSDLYIVDGENKRVLKLNSSRTPELSFGNYDWGEGVLAEPVSICVSQDDRIYVSDRQAGHISVYDYFGTFLFYLGENTIKRPAGLCMDMNGMLWITDPALEQVLAFDRSGRLLLQWGSPGSKLGAFQNPNDVAAYQNRLYVADSDNHRIQIFEIY
jgi:tripartite motif-containing protein 71